MTLASGTKLGAYEILEPIGAGGMGEVYRAQDTRIDRTVAIKVLPSALERKPAEEEVVSAVMPRRSALLYSGNVLHGGGANRTDEIRIGLYAGFLLSWLRPIENHLVTNGIETLKTAAPQVQRLLDYSDTGWEVIA